MTRRTKKFFREVAMELARFAIYAAIAFLAILAACLVLSLPEIIGTLIFG